MDAGRHADALALGGDLPRHRVARRMIAARGGGYVLSGATDRLPASIDAPVARPPGAPACSFPMARASVSNNSRNVPVVTKCAFPRRSRGDEAGNDVVAMLVPGEEMSGFLRPSAVGPAELVGEMTSSARSAVPAVSTLPTVMTLYAMPGFLKAYGKLPSFPAATAMVFPYVSTTPSKNLAKPSSSTSEMAP